MLTAKILQFMAHRENGNYKDTPNIMSALRCIFEAGGDLYDPESVKACIRNMPLEDSTKENYCKAYEAFLKFMGGNWERPRYKAEEKVPFIPLEDELDQLIAALSPMLAAFCQVLKETGARVGEAARILWTEVDFERRLIYINHPEKGSNTGVYPVSEKCVNMLKKLRKKSLKVFQSKKSIQVLFYRQRKRIADKLSNPRILETHLHTFRHWKGTFEAYKTRDPFHVQRTLRHKSLANTQRYIHWAEAIWAYAKEDEWTVKVAHTIQEACELIKVGFVEASDWGAVKIYKKRK